MNIGVVSRALGCGLFSIVLLACGGSDGSDTPKTNCGTVQAPTPLELKNVSPAAGASVANSGIVQTFTIVGKRLQISPSFALPAAHTAGQPIPTPTTWTLTLDGDDTVYTSQPMSWTTAPAHVEIDASGLQQTQDGCVFALPKPIFAYDITAP